MPRATSLQTACGAPTRNEDAQGSNCMNPKGFRTDHPGQGQCFLHGGGAIISHGRYSNIKRRSLQEIIERHSEDDNPLNMLPELATARALFEDFINRYDDITEALITWHHSHGEVLMTEERVEMLKDIVYRFDRFAKTTEIPPQTENHIKEAKRLLGRFDEYFQIAQKPTVVMDIAEAYRFLAEITKIVERIEKIRANNAISRRNFHRVTSEMGRSLNLILDASSSGLLPFDENGTPICIYDSQGKLIDIRSYFEMIKSKVHENWASIQVQQ